ncbi:type II secretion system F family protein [Halomonas koreensis]|uniref:Type II secretion system F family protein n=1 Tax=Halomonas koreensis TaxID=245385 RepID=A0ABU1G3E3_9GAMM|nr:type II secretion system F family protein [Halomonas koreensis]MDR5867053.1 type II secretion system F family protein [Halomonas koreensis]
MTAWQLWSATMLLLMLAAWLLWRSANRESERAVLGRRQARRRRRGRRLPTDSMMQWLLDSLLAAGVHATPRAVVVFLLLVSAALVLAMALFGVRLALGILAVLLAMKLLLRARARRLRGRIRAQLPTFMEQVVRELGTGATVEIAFRRNGPQAGGLLREAMGRVAVRRELGMELHEALRREADLLKLREFDLLATAVEVNQVHGGSLRNILGSFVDLLRQQERGRRELRALTGETRVTAAVLAAVPVALAVFMAVGNPAFLAPMLDSDGGRLALWAAVALEVGGCAALWRMLKSI